MQIQSEGYPAGVFRPSTDVNFCMDQFHRHQNSRLYRHARVFWAHAKALYRRLATQVSRHARLASCVNTADSTTGVVLVVHVASNRYLRADGQEDHSIPERP